MTRPLDRNARLPALGKIDREAGEFWAENPFLMPGRGQNLSAFERNRLYLNLQGRSFLDASFASRADLDSDSRAVVAADFDRDGAPDLLVSSVGGGPLRLFLNRFPRTTRRVRIELVGLESNRPAIGTRIVAEAGGRQIIRDLFAPNPGMGQGPVELIVGLGAAERLGRLTIRWPAGRVQKFADLPVDSQLTITEGQAEYAAADLSAPDRAPSATGGHK